MRIFSPKKLLRLKAVLIVPVCLLLFSSFVLYGCSSDSGSDSGSDNTGNGTTTTKTVTSVKLNHASLNLILGLDGYSSGTFSATVEGNNLEDSDKGVTWSSSKESVATVTQAGVVTAVALGNAVITATSKYDTSKTATCSVSVTSSTVSGTTVWNFSTQPSNIGTDEAAVTGSIAAISGSSATLSVSATKLKWASGYLQSGKSSNSTYENYSSKSTATYTLTTTTTATITIVMTGSGDLATDRWLVVTNSSGTIVDKIESSETSTQQTITITDAAAGVYTIYTSGVRIYSITVTGESSGGTVVPPTGIKLTDSTLSFDLNDDTEDTATLTYTLTPDNVTSGYDKVTWSTSASSVAEVSSSGVVTAKKAGTAVITVTTDTGSFEDTCTVTVTGTATNSIKASDLPKGFASAGTYTTTPTTASYGSYANPVTTYAQLKSAISAGGLIYVKGMIPLAYYESSDGTVKGSMLPSTSGGTTAALDAFVADKTSYANYAAWKKAYIETCETDTDDESYSLCEVGTLYNAYKKIVQLNLISNTTLIGIDSESGLVGGTLSISNISNVAIRNLILRDAYDPFPHHEAGDGWNSQYDGIVIQNTTSGIWIDHCTIEDTMNGSDATNDYVTNASGKKEHWNPYDGQCDIKGTANSVTVSYCKFKNHDKSMLICSGSGDTGTKNVTIMNCGFYGITQRTPLVGHANVHMYNCYFDSGNGNYTSSYAIGCRYAFKVIAENNYFTSAIENSVLKSSSPAGSIYLSGNTDNSKSGVDSNMSSYIVYSAPFDVGYVYSDILSASAVPESIKANAGAGTWPVVQ